MNERVSQEVRILQKRFSYAYSDAVEADDDKTTITLDIKDLNYVLFALEQYLGELRR